MKYKVKVTVLDTKLYAEHRQPFDEIKHRHTFNEVGDVAEGGMTGRLREDEVE